MGKTLSTSNDGRNPRPLLYVYVSPDEPRCYWIYGVSFAEFFKAMRIRRTLVLLSKEYLDPCDEDPVTGFNFVEPAKLQQLANEDIYGACGDFIWVDVDRLRSLRRISQRDLARLLYLGHAFRPWGSPFFDSLQNRFAYLAHDDGWLLRLYARHSKDMERLTEALVRNKSRHFLRRKIETRGLGRKLLKLAREGVACDFQGGNSGGVRLLHPGKFKNMDSLLTAIDGGKSAVLDEIGVPPV